MKDGSGNVTYLGPSDKNWSNIYMSCPSAADAMGFVGCDKGNSCTFFGLSSQAGYWDDKKNQWNVTVIKDAPQGGKGSICAIPPAKYC